MGVLLVWQIGDLQLVGTVLGGMVGTLIILAIFAYGLVRSLNIFRDSVGVAWRFGLANIARRPASSMMQIVAFGLGIMVMLLLSTVRADLLRDWQRSLPPDAANHFLVNIQPDQIQGVKDFFNKNGVNKTQVYPMVRARLVTINGKAVSTDDYESQRAKHLITREFNLSWAAHMQPDNKIVEGAWWSKNEFGKPLLSVEAKLAQTLKMKLNDELGFDINGTEVKVTISSLRTVDWDSFNVNFFTVAPPGLLEQYPANWITSVYLDAGQKQKLAQLVRDYPNVTIIDIQTIMERVRGIMDRVTLAVEFIFLFTILAGLAVLYAAIQASQDERRFESAVLRTLGARKKILLLGLVAEFSTLGLLSGFLAGIAATSLAWMLAKNVFKFAYQVDPTIILTGMVSGALIVVIAGLLGTRSVLTHPPVQTLREGAA